MADLAPSAVIDNMNAVLATSPSERELAIWNKRREQGLRDRRRYEPTWHLCQSFVASRQWVGWAPGSARGGGRIVQLPNPGNRERHTENVITTYLWTVIGKLLIDDFMPNLLFRREDIESEDFTLQAQRALAWAWDEEIQANEQILDTLLKMTTYGTAALRCYYDPSRGAPIGDMPVGPDGQVISNVEQARTYVAQAQQSGQRVKFRSVYEGKIIWEPLSPMNIITPPGVEHERYFPWLICERPMPVERIRSMFPEAGEIKGQDLTAVDTVGVREMPSADPLDPGTGGLGKLEDHGMLSTGYAMPTREHPAGRTVIWSNNQLLSTEESLPYELNGEPHHGVIFFKYHRVPSRFWAIGVVEPLIGPQRQRNRARSQQIEMKDRAGLGRVYAHKGTLTASNKPVGKIMEVIEIPMGMPFPQETSGTGPGPWLKDEAEMSDMAMDKIAGIREVSLGQAPAGVSAYSAMALLAEQDDKRVGPILKMIRTQIADATKLTLHDIKSYWPADKQIALAGPSNQIESFVFNAAKLPEMVYVQIPQGASKPQSPAAMIQLIFDIWNAAIASGRPLQLTWLENSIAQGKPVPVPRNEQDAQAKTAELENLLMSQSLQPLRPNYFDDDFIHVQEHRQEQIESGGAGNEQLAQVLEFHIQLHLESAQAKSSGVGPGAGSNLPQNQGPQGQMGGQPAQATGPTDVRRQNNSTAPAPPGVR